MRLTLASSLLLLLTHGCAKSTGGIDPTDLGASTPPDLAAPTVDLSGGGCRDNSDCKGGLCIAGFCCAGTPCGANCCTGNTVCLFDRCVLPGRTCHTANECAQGQYCETSLGGRDGGAGSDGGTCTQPPPSTGRCLDLPPLCNADGGVGPDAGCIDRCEFHPTAGGPLDAVAKWTWGPTAQQYPGFTDVWSTPAVGRVVDANCDGVIDENDPPNVIFVAGNVAPSNKPRDNGVLRVLDGRTGQEVWSLAAAPGSKGFMGFSVAIGDVDVDGRIDIVAVTGEGYVVLIDNRGRVVRTSDRPIANNDGWGGGLALADMDADGFPEIAFANLVFSTTNNTIRLRLTAPGGSGGGANEPISIFADLDGAPNNHLELLLGSAAIRSDGSTLWNRSGDLPDGFPAVGDFNKDGRPEVVLVETGKVWVLDGLTGVTMLGPATLGGTGTGGPPTIADFDGDGKPEIGVAQANYYTVLKPDFVRNALVEKWKVPNHDLSSSVTGSSVFDFEGDGIAEVIYGDECFLWVYEGPTGKVRFATPHTSFTATEASVVADVDGDGRAEILMVSNGADPGPNGWKCDVLPWNAPDPVMGRPAWVAPKYGPAYRGIVAFGDRANGWVGTRTLWNQHAYHVTNICDDRDTACAPPNTYGSIPRVEKPSWLVPWLNNYRQNVQDKGLFDAPDATVSLTIECLDPPLVHPAVRNIGQASLPAGAEVEVFKVAGMAEVSLGTAATTRALLPGQVEQLSVRAPPGLATFNDQFVARIKVDPQAPIFRECRSSNDASPVTKAVCLQ